MASARRRAAHRYLGSRIRGSAYSRTPLSGMSKDERTKLSKSGPGGERRPVVLPLRVRPDGRWGYRFRRLRGLK